MNESTPPADEQPPAPVPLPPDESEVVYVPPPLDAEATGGDLADFSPSTSPPRIHADPPMDRQTMWTWFAFGGALWLVGFLVLGIWLGGCFDSSPPSNPKNGRSAP